MKSFFVSGFRSSNDGARGFGLSGRLEKRSLRAVCFEGDPGQAEAPGPLRARGSGHALITCLTARRSDFSGASRLKASMWGRDPLTWDRAFSPQVLPSTDGIASNAHS